MNLEENRPPDAKFTVAGLRPGLKDFRHRRTRLYAAILSNCADLSMFFAPPAPAVPDPAGLRGLKPISANLFGSPETRPWFVACVLWTLRQITSYVFYPRGKSKPTGGTGQYLPAPPERPALLARTTVSLNEPGANCLLAQSFSAPISAGNFSHFSGKIDVHHDGAHLGSKPPPERRHAECRNKHVSAYGAMPGSMSISTTCPFERQSR